MPRRQRRVPNARVTFRVISGRGKLSERGNGRAIGVQTDSSGYARANFTPLDGGTISSGKCCRRYCYRRRSRSQRGQHLQHLAQGILADRRTPPGPTTSKSGCACRRGESSADVMGRRWCDLRTCRCRVEQRFAPSVDNALNIAIGGGKVYWTEKTGESAGTINSANLNGSDVTELTSIKAVPMGIAVDTAEANSTGRTPVVESRVRTSTVPVSRT